MSKPSEFCEKYVSRAECFGANPCTRCGGAPNAHILHDVKTRRRRKCRARLVRVHAPRRPADERIPPEVLARARDPVFRGLFYKVRLACTAENCPGYFVIRGRADRRYRFGGCSRYRELGCKASVGSWEYVVRKSAAVDDVIAGRPPRYPIRFVAAKPRAPETAVPWP